MRKENNYRVGWNTFILKWKSISDPVSFGASVVVWNVQQKNIKKLRGLSPGANCTNRAPTFADRGCHVVSVTDPHGLIWIKTVQ
jgi:hypothetical protein